MVGSADGKHSTGIEKGSWRSTSRSSSQIEVKIAGGEDCSFVPRDYLTLPNYTFVSAPASLAMAVHLIAEAEDPDWYASLVVMALIR